MTYKAYKICGALALLLIATLLVWRTQRQPDCNCYLPNLKRFGVVAGSIGCEVRPCNITSRVKDHAEQRIREMQGAKRNAN